MILDGDVRILLGHQLGLDETRRMARVLQTEVQFYSSPDLADQDQPNSFQIDLPTDDPQRLFIDNYHHQLEQSTRLLIQTPDFRRNLSDNAVIIRPSGILIVSAPNPTRTSLTSLTSYRVLPSGISYTRGSYNEQELKTIDPQIEAAITLATSSH